MNTYEILKEISDARRGGSACIFNGYLEDYIGIDGISHKELFEKLHDLDSELRIIVNLKLAVCESSISNQIIRYHDIFKLKENAIVIPYIIYSKKEDKRRVLIIDDKDYIYAKAMYYCISENDSLLHDGKEEMVTCFVGDDIVDLWSKIYELTSGKLQRMLDNKHFENYEKSLEHAKELAFKIDKELEKPQENKQEFINSCVSRWFLLKKYLYVQYMMDKKILTNKFDGNIKKQRNQAKLYSEEIKYICLSKLWEKVK